MGVTDGNPTFAHFDSTTTLKALYRRTTIKSGAHTHCTDVSGIHESTQFVSVPPLIEVLRYSASNTVTWSKHNRIMFDFYPGLAHIPVTEHDAVHCVSTLNISTDQQPACRGKTKSDVL